MIFPGFYPIEQRIFCREKETKCSGFYVSVSVVKAMERKGNPEDGGGAALEIGRKLSYSPPPYDYYTTLNGHGHAKAATPTSKSWNEEPFK